MRASLKWPVHEADASVQKGISHLRVVTENVGAPSGSSTVRELSVVRTAERRFRPLGVRSLLRDGASADLVYALGPARNYRTSVPVA